jgi:hypothetical protein
LESGVKKRVRNGDGGRANSFFLSSPSCYCGPINNRPVARFVCNKTGGSDVLLVNDRERGVRGATIKPQEMIQLTPPKVDSSAVAGGALSLVPPAFRDDFLQFVKTGHMSQQLAAMCQPGTDTPESRGVQKALELHLEREAEIFRRFAETIGTERPSFGGSLRSALRRLRSRLQARLHARSKELEPKEAEAREKVAAG